MSNERDQAPIPDRNADKKNWFTAMKHYLQRESQKLNMKHPHRVPAGDKPQVIKYVEGGEQLPDTKIHVEDGQVS